MSTLRMIAVGSLLHAKHLSRSSLEITIAMLVPLVQATLAVYLFRAGGEPHRLLEAAVGAGLMGVWSSVLFGSGGAIQNQRWQGTLEMIMLAPRPPALVILPITLATALTGTYAMVATLLWGRLLYGIPLDFAHPLAFAVAVPGCILSLGMFGLLLAATFVLMRNANALANTLEYPIWLLSGMLVPITVLPGWTTPLAAVLPTTWGARAVREAATGSGPVWPALAICLAISTVCLLLGAVAMTHVERRARTAATLALA
ncbi:ABC transporter permease [Micromonospora sp. NPDC050397]|uniref:ABC transporter permease n=1 Tax=Micromonospora sp. NPDC050397 TaxID=3364279 RepID=UPI00384D8886